MNQKTATRCVSLLSTALGFLVWTAGPALGGTITTEFKDLKIRFDANAMTGPTATSLMLTLEGINAKLVTIRSDVFGTVKAESGGVFILSGGTLADTKTVTVRIKSAVGQKIKGTTAIFLNDSNSAQGVITGGALEKDPVYTITNDLVPSANLTVQGLLFYENHVPIDDQTIDPAVPIDSTGIPEPSAMLDGPGTFRDYMVPPIADGTYFYVQGQIVDQATGEVKAWFIDGFTTTVISEPPSALLVIVAAPLLLGLRRLSPLSNGRQAR